MPSPEEWDEILSIDTNDAMHVASRSDGVYVFYSEEVEVNVRTDHVVDVESWR